MSLATHVARMGLCLPTPARWVNPGVARSARKTIVAPKKSQKISGDRIEESPRYVDAMTAPLHPGGCFLRAKRWGAVQFPGAVWRPPPPIRAFSLEDDRAWAARERAITQ